MEKQYKSGKSDLITGAIFCAFSAAYFIMATRIAIPGSLKASLLDASSIPKLWGGMLFLLGVILLLRGLGKIRGAKKAGYTPESSGGAAGFKKFVLESRSAIAMFVILFVYIALLQPLGFLISTVLFLFGEFFVLTRREERKIWLIALLAVVFGVGIYALFRYGFTMPLPRGVVTFF